MNQLVETRRWLCIDCGTEGRGPPPSCCRICSDKAGWFINIGFHEDDRSMSQILLDQIMGYEDAGDLNERRKRHT